VTAASAFRSGSGGAAVPYRRFGGQVVHHGDAVAVRKTDAVHAVGPDVDRQLGPLDGGKAEAAEEFRLEGQAEKLGDAEVPGLRHAGFHQTGCDSPAAVGRRDHQGSDFGQGFPAELKGAAARHRPVFRIDRDAEIPQMIVEAAKGPGHQVSLARVGVQQLVDGRDVRNGGFSDVHCVSA